MNTKILTIIMVILMATCVFAQTGSIKGTVMEKGTGTILQGANVFLKGTSIGASSGNSGQFEINDVPTGRYELVISYIGYASHNTVVTVADGEVSTISAELSQSDFMGESVVVTASKRVEKITEAPATINVISAQRVNNYAGNPGELLAYEKGVDFVRIGVQGTGINIRGFNSAFNAKNLQMNDARLSTLIATGLPMGSFATTVKDDIERMEVILGPNAALYGPNAHNGLVNTITKDPRTSEGTTVAVGGGNQSTIGGRLRHAKVVNDFFRYKVTAEYAQGEEFNYVDSVYIGGAAFDELNLDRDFDSMRGEANFYFSPNPESDVILTYGASNSNNLAVTNAGRNQIKDWQIQFVQAQYVSPRLFAQVYHTWSKTEDTYAINQRTQNYWSFIGAGFSEAEAVERSLHEQWFGTSPTDGIALNRESNFKDNSKRLNAETQYNNTWSGFDVTVGAQFQRDMADSKGTYLLDEGGIDIDQMGAYAQIETALGETGLELIAAARLDDHDLYGSNFIPKGGLIYKSGSNNLRLTYGKGIAAPSILNLSANIFGGLLLGNGEGFTLADGTQFPALEVETIQTIEAGYKGILNEKLYLDANGYYNFHENFISPLINIAATSPVVARGSTPMSEVLGVDESAFLLTYLNFGKVNTYGFDLGINYFLSPELTLRMNYSYFDFDIDKNDLQNDGNQNGVVDENDLPINTPKHKLSLNAFYNKDKIFGGLGARWVDEYDFFSGINVAASTNEDLVYGGSPVVEGQRVGRDFNEGPLGGYVSFDLSAGYKLTPNASVAAQVTNLFDSEVRDFVASPVIGRLMSVELKYTFY